MQNSQELHPGFQRKPDSGKRENKLGASIEDTGRKIMQIKETIEKETQRIYSIEQKIAAAKKVQSDELENIDLLTRTLSEINAQREALLNKSSTVETDLKIANKEKPHTEKRHFHTQADITSPCLHNFCPYWHPTRHQVAQRASYDWIWRQFFGNPVFILPTGCNRNRTGRKLPNACDTGHMGCKYYPFVGAMFIFRKLLHHVNSPYNILDFY